MLMISPLGETVRHGRGLLLATTLVVGSLWAQPASITTTPAPVFGAAVFDAAGNLYFFAFGPVTAGAAQNGGGTSLISNGFFNSPCFQSTRTLPRRLRGQGQRRRQPSLRYQFGRRNRAELMFGIEKSQKALVGRYQGPKEPSVAGRQAEGRGATEGNGDGESHVEVRTTRNKIGG